MKSYQYRENIAMALQTLTAHKFRSFLTILGIIIGVLTVIVIASILTGLRQNVITFIEEYGTNNIFAFHLSTGPQFGRRPREEWLRKPLTVDDALADIEKLGRGGIARPPLAQQEISCRDTQQALRLLAEVYEHLRK